MTYSRGLFIAWLALCLPALAAEPTSDTRAPRWKVTFFTDPPGAQVFHAVVGPRTSQNYAGDYLGLSGQELDINPVFFQDPVDHHFLNHQDIVFVLAGYDRATVSVDESLFTNHRWPDHGAVRLQPDNWRSGLRDALGHHPLALGLTPLLGLLALGTALRLRAQRQAFALRLQRIESYRHAAGNDQWVGVRLGDYVLTSRLGAGGMALVYRALPQRTLDEAEAVAVKVLNEQATADPQFRERFVREVQVCQQLDHPNIVRLIDWGVEEPLFLVMELVEGQTLGKLIPPQGLPLAEAMRLLKPVMHALVYAHGKSIVHRDLKPENIMVTNSALVKVMDFGLARATKVDSKLTSTGIALGTPAYIAPEQIAGDLVPSADQYSLGLVAYEMLAGRRPFPEVQDLSAALTQHITADPVPLRSYRADVPPKLEAAIMRMIEKDPNDRFASVQEALNAVSTV